MILSILLTVATPYLLNTLTNDMTLLQSWRDSFICVTWCMTVYLLGPLKGDMTHSCVRHDSFIYVTWLIHMCGVTHPYMWHSPWLSTCWEHSRVTKKKKFICVSWFVHMCDMTHDCVPVGIAGERCIQLSVVSGPPVSVCDVTHSHVWHDSRVIYSDWFSYLLCLALQYLCDMTHAYVWHNWRVM